MGKSEESREENNDQSESADDENGDNERPLKEEATE